MKLEPRGNASPRLPISLRTVGLAILALTGVLIGVALIAVSSRPVQVRASAPPPPPQPLPMLDAEEYVLIGWNDLGMHCMNENFENLAVLPPYNTLWAQVIRKGTRPEVVTTTLSVAYSFLDNTYSVGKTNFWDYANQLFGVNLAPNVGLTGATLAGDMDAKPDHFVIEGVPLTPYRDSAPQPGPANWYPYQLAHMVARDATTGEILAETTTVAPVSTEMRCDFCHSDGQRENISTGNVETNILTLHDREHGTNLMGQRPVLCAQCHGSNALGAPGNPRLPNLSRAMHKKHEDFSKTSEGCYNCHPGTQTQCQRDVMFVENGMTCVDCHGTAADVADTSRRPWIDLPRCENCHLPQFAENPDTLYRNSVGHGGIYCEACHGSPHAILPTNQANDNIQNIALQGFAGTLSDCKVCHGPIVPMGPGPHGLTADDIATPGPTATPTNTSVPGATATPTSTRQPSPTVGPTATSGPSPTPSRREVEFAGVVESRPSGRIGMWRIDGRNVTVDATTRFDEKKGPAIVGASVKLRGMQDAGGNILAQRITVQSTGDRSRETKFIGTIQQLPSGGLLGAWLVSGNTVNVDAQTEVHGNASRYRVGAVVKIHGRRLADNTVTADEVSLADD